MTRVAIWGKENGAALVDATTTLVLTRCWCGCPVGVPEGLETYARRHSDQAIYCPLGHCFVYNDATDKQNSRLKDQLAATRAAHEQTLAEVRAQKAAKTRFRHERDRLRERVAAGVCPCCHRSFKQLRAHMARKHPTYEGA